MHYKYLNDLKIPSCDCNWAAIRQRFLPLLNDDHSPILSTDQQL